MGALCSAIITETNTVASVRDTLQAVEFVTSANQQDAPGKSPIWYTWRSETLENSAIHVAFNVARNARGGDLGVGKTLCTRGCTEFPSQSDTTELPRLKSTLACCSHVERPPLVQESFFIQVHTAGSSTMELPLARGTTQLLSSALSMHTSTPYSESTFGAEHGKGSQQAVFLTQRLLGISDTEYIALRAPACARVACQQLLIAATTDNVVVQAWYIRAHIRNARQILSPEDVQKDSHWTHPKKTCGKSTELVYPDTADRAKLVY